MKKCGFLGGKQAIKSLRSSGYKDTSMAIGELIDNSIQAGSDDIIIVLVCNYTSGVRSTKRVNTIAVIDNGHGMNDDLLQSSLVLGEGSNRYEEEGMGKFGVGLPQASISQTQRVDVWSKTVDSDYRHVYVDLGNDDWLNDAEIKNPDNVPIPKIYEKYLSSKCGTIVEWSNVDHVSWKRPETVFQKCENQIGRMYRNWLTSEKVKISLVSVLSDGKEIGERTYFRPVDPLFLMKDSKCGNPPEIPMFREYRPDETKHYKIPQVDGTSVEVSVKIRCSIAKESVRLDDITDSPGSQDYGKMAKSCMGVSIVREDRELELNNQWFMKDPKDPRHRWWGIEISFDRDLDDIFGVTNNKQSATKLNEMSKLNYEQIMDELDIDSSGDPDRDKKYLEKESIEDYILMDVVTTVQDYIGQMYDNIVSNTKKVKKSKATRYGVDSEAQKKYDDVVNTRSKDESKQSQTDILITQRGDDRTTVLKQELDVADGYSEEDKGKVISDVENGHRCTILISSQDSSSFFNIDRQDTQMVVRLNSRHPMYDQLFGVFVDLLTGEKTDADEMRITVSDAFETIQFLLAAWARMEDEDHDPKMKREYRRIREKWGEILEDSF